MSQRDPIPTGRTAAQTPLTPDKRRRPNPAEHARRVAWGKQWGQVGHDYAVKLRQREGR